ncbi:hypothetical protein TNCV_2393971 [Trichonephila clavipes]|nr:hypothetical protein TNCV_2393971 [Trichonephila clavipes]
MILYPIPTENLKSQRDFLQKVRALKELHSFHFELEDLIKSSCSTERYDFALSTELLHEAQKKEVGNQILRILSLETLDTLYQAIHGRKHLRSAQGSVVHKSIGGDRLHYCSHLNCHRLQRSMERFTNTEPEDIHLIYGLAKGNARAAERLYRERYP